MWRVSGTGLADPVLAGSTILFICRPFCLPTLRGRSTYISYVTFSLALKLDRGKTWGIVDLD